MNCLIVDDEQHARNKLRRLLNKSELIDRISDVSNGLDAIYYVNNEHPDIVFMDIEMPELGGFETISEFNSDNFPAIVFVTAYDKYAVQAFEVDAIDYLLKPVNQKRLSKTLLKIKNQIQSESQKFRKENYLSILNSLRESGGDKKIAIKERDKYHLLNPQSIDWIKSDGNYVKIKTAEKQYFIRHTLSELLEKLDNEIFYQTHRSYIVNIEKIKSIENHTYGNFLIQLEDGESIPMTRNYSQLLEVFTKL